MNPSHCPSDDRLGRLLAQGLSPDDRRDVAAHVDGCDRCQAALERMTDFAAAIGPVLVPPTEADQPARFAMPGYEFRERLGRGGNGVVYLAWEWTADRPVAVKLLRDGFAATPDERVRFRADAAALARLSHPNVVTLLAVGEHAGHPYLVMEYLPGGSLAAPAGQPPGELTTAVDRLLGVCAGVQHAHDKGVTHRDLKPANVLLSADGTPKVADFGLGKLDAGGAGPTPTTAVLGTPAYMAPEVAFGRTRAAGPAADVYGLGAIGYELVTGNPPFQGASPYDTLLQVRDQEPQPPRVLRHDLPRDLETVLLKCLEKDPARRYPTAAALAADLQRFRAGEPVTARPLGPLGRLARQGRRHPGVASLLGLLAAVVAGGIGGFAALWRHADAQRAVAEGRLGNTREALAAYTSTAERRYWNPKTVTPDERATLDRAFALQVRLAADYPDDPAARYEAGYALLQLGVVADRLGDLAGAVERAEAGVTILRGVVAQAPDTPRYRAGLAEGYAQLAGHLSRAGRRPEAIPLTNEAARLARRLVVERPATDHYRGLLGNFIGAQARSLSGDHRFAEAEPLLNEYCAICRALAAKYPTDPVRQMYLGNALVSLAEAAARTDPRPDRTAATLAEAAAAFRAARATGPDMPFTYQGQVVVHQLLAYLAYNTGAGGPDELTRAIELAAGLARDHPAVAEYRQVQGRLLFYRGIRPPTDEPAARADREAAFALLERQAAAPDAPPEYRTEYALHLAADPAADRPRLDLALRLIGPQAEWTASYDDRTAFVRFAAGDAPGTLEALRRAADRESGLAATSDFLLLRAMARWQGGDRSGAAADLAAGSPGVRTDWLAHWNVWRLHDRAWRLITGGDPPPRRTVPKDHPAAR